MFKIKEDTITDYLNELESLIEEEKPQLLNTLMREVVGYPYSFGGFVAPLMSTKWNPFLYSSGQDSSMWHGEIGEVSRLETVYSGMKLHQLFDKPKVWSEFATPETKNQSDPRKRKLARDYAYFQETGIDPIADPRYAKHKHAVEEGFAASTNHVIAETGKYVERLMQLQKGKHITTDKTPVNSFFK